MRFPLLRSFYRKRNIFAALASEACAPFFRIATRDISPSKPANEWRKGLLLGADHIGDLLYRSCSLLQLKEGLPNCEWHILASGISGEVLKGHPAIAKLHPIDLPSSKSSDEFRSLESEKFDTIICYNTGQYFRNLKLAVDLRIPNRVAYVHKGFSAWTTYPVPIRYPQPFPAYFRDLVGHLTGKVDASPLRPQVFPSAEDERQAAELLAALNINDKEIVLPCFMTTRQPRGVWPAEKIARSVRILEDRHPSLKTLLLGAPSDGELLAKLKQEAGLRAPVVRASLNLRALVAFLARAKAVLTTDSGPRHLANAAGAAPIFFRNLWADPIETGVYLEQEVDLAPPNIGRLKPKQQEKYFDAVTPENAADAVTKVLRSTGNL